VPERVWWVQAPLGAPKMSYKMICIFCGKDVWCNKKDLTTLCRKCKRKHKKWKKKNLGR